MSTPSPSGFVLAGGLSRRLGRDKALLAWQPPQSLTMLEHMTRLLRTVCHQVIIVGRQTPLFSLEEYRDAIRWLPDRTPGLGPLGGISTALHSSTTDLNIVVAVDLPFLTSDFLNYFKQRSQQVERHLTVCKIESAFPLCIGIRTAFLDSVDRYIAVGRRSLHGLIESGDPEIVGLEELRNAGFSEAIFTNINTETDYLAALQTINRNNP